jgi:hypothetical protein
MSQGWGIVNLWCWVAEASRSQMGETAELGSDAMSRPGVDEVDVSTKRPIRCGRASQQCGEPASAPPHVNAQVFEGGLCQLHVIHTRAIRHAWTQQSPACRLDLGMFASTSHMCQPIDAGSPAMPKFEMSTKVRKGPFVAGIPFSRLFVFYVTNI